MICRDCKQDKPRSEFWVASHGGRCKPCACGYGKLKREHYAALNEPVRVRPGGIKRPYTLCDVEQQMVRVADAIIRAWDKAADEGRPDFRMDGRMRARVREHRRLR